MTKTVPPPFDASFNLWHEPWIRVLDQKGARRSLSIKDVLLQAHTLKAFYDPSPLTVAGVHRLLAAILQAIYKPRDLADIGEILDEQQLDATHIRAFGEQHAERFELFHSSAPFLQTGDVPLDAWRKAEKPKGRKVAAKEQAGHSVQDTNAEQQSATGAAISKIEPKTSAYLLEEVPAGTNRTHFRHVMDKDHRLCPACCARSLVTIPAFAKSGGAGIKPSINGVPPVYLLPVGKTLFHSLALSLVGKNYRPAIVDEARQTAAWNGATIVPRSGELIAVGYLESLTFPARRVRLFPLHDAGRCTHCGQPSSIRVKDMLYEMGWSRSKSASLWKDPFVAYKPAKEGKEPNPLRPSQGKALWRDYGVMFLADADLQPALVRQITGLIEDRIVQTDQRLRFRCIGIKTDGKAKVFEWLDDALDVPSALLRDERGAAAVREALARSEEVVRTIRFIFTRHMKPERGGKQEHFLGIRARMEDEYWTALALPFRELISTAATVDAVDQARDRWARTILTEAQRTFDAALKTLGDRADMLRRRVEAHTHCRNVLAKYRREWNLE